MSEEKKSWSKSDIFVLISDWEHLPELWDVKSKFYRNRFKKQCALHKLAAKFSTTVNEVSRKLHNLRTQFHSELRKVKAKKCGDEADESYRSTWEFYDAVKFISCHRSNPSIADCLIIETEQKYKVPERNDDATEQKYNITDNNDDTTMLNETPKERQIKRRVRRTEPDYVHLVKKPSYLMYKPADEFQIFGDYVASELRSLRSKQNQRRLKLDIQKAVIRASEINLTESSTRQSHSSFSQPHTPNSGSVGSYLSDFAPYEEGP